MMRKILWALVALLLLQSLHARVLTEAEFADKAGEQLQKKVSESGDPFERRLYKDLYYIPVWVGPKGPTRFARDLFSEIGRDSTLTEGMPLYREYRRVRKEFRDLAGQGHSLDDALKAELDASRLYRDYMRYRLYGGIDWEAFDRELKRRSKEYETVVGWDHYAPVKTPEQLLVDATLSGSLKKAFFQADPHRFAYARLRQYLIKYIELARRGGWGSLPPFKRIRPGQKHRAIPAIRRHLALVGDLGACTTNMNSTLYDRCLQKAVRRFRLRHGLKASSVIDSRTRRLLNQPIGSLIRKIRLNLDRIKWLWHREPRVRIELNIPAFRLYIYEGTHLVDTMRVIVGKPNHPTPSFHDTMEYLVVNPYWKIPESIVKKEMLKHLIADPYYYERRGKLLHASWSEDSPRVDPGTVDWAKYKDNDKHIPYYFMQLPSSRNALGKIKFLFPNRYSVYIHDTPSKSLFFRDRRAFSHGCMRIQKPRELLETLARYNDNIHVDEIMSLLTTTQKKTIGLRHKIPVDIVYLTAFVDPYGNLNFRDDIYGYDGIQLKNYRYKEGSAPGRVRKSPRTSVVKSSGGRHAAKAAPSGGAKRPSTPVSQKAVKRSGSASRPPVAKRPQPYTPPPMEDGYRIIEEF